MKYYASYCEHYCYYLYVPNISDIIPHTICYTQSTCLIQLDKNKYLKFDI